MIPMLNPYFFRAILHLCISDTNKIMLVQNENLVPLLLSSLILEPDHVRQAMSQEPKAGIQADGTECFQQLALSERGRELLLHHEALVCKALQAVAEYGLSSEAKESARGTLMAMRGGENKPVRPIGGGHVMLSYQWSSQKTIIRINKSLQRRGYATWLDGKTARLLDPPVTRVVVAQHRT